MERKLDDWASDPPVGYPGAIAPLPGKKAEGWANGEEPPAGHFNYAWQSLGDVQNEVANAIEGLGVTLDGSDLSQLLKALIYSHHRLALSTLKLAEDVGTNLTLNGLARDSDITIAVGASGSIQRLVLSNGAYTAGGFAADTPDSSYSGAFQDVVFAEGKFVAVGTLEEIQTSVGDGAWDTRHSGSETLFAIAYGGGTFVAVGASGTILYSADGITWNAASSAITDDFHSVVYFAGKFVAGTDTHALAYSSDGVTWTVVFDNADVSEPSTMAASSSMGGFYCWDDQVYHSSDGVTWTEIQSVMAPRMFAGPYFWAIVYREGAGSRIVGYYSTAVDAPANFTVEYALPAAYLTRLYLLGGQYWALGGTSGSFDQIYIGGAV